MATKKLPFRTMLDEPVINYSNPGSRIEDVWAMKLDENGNEEFYIEGQTNVYEKIQAYAEEVELENILKRVTDTGDISLLNQRKSVFTDITGVPKNMIDAANMIKTAEKEFYNLPLETREKFDNNFNNYIAKAGTEEWAKKMGYIKEKVEEKIEEKIENKEEEKE